MTAREYLPWVRTGIAAAITEVDPLTGPVPARAELTVTATVNGGRTAGAPIRVYGPGDVLGFAAGHVIRREPVPDCPDAEPNYFPLIEFNRPDLPWLFTPAVPNADRLRPWIVMVAIRRDRVEVDATAGKLPVLRVADAREDLPDLAESWAWAHAQAAGTADLAGTSSALSRLVCPRLLEAGTRYLTAVVPAFELGRRAGLGLAIDETAATTEPAWVATTTALDLPAYLWWEFVTGPEGDFEALVTRLSRGGLDATIGRPLSVADLPAGLPDLAGWLLPGALGACPDPLPGTDFLNRLQDLVSGTPSPDLVLPPPIYGRWHAAVSRLSVVAPPWLVRLNLDPRYRAAAAVGALIVQEHQDGLVAAAWRQAGEIEAANELLRRGQVARASGTVAHSQLKTVSPETLLQLTGPLHGRVLGSAADVTVATTIAASRVPPAMAGSAFRRVVRPRGRLARRAATTGSALLAGVNDGRLALRRLPARPDGMVVIDEVTGPEHVRLCQLGSARLGSDGKQRHGGASQRQWDEFLAAAIAHQRPMPGCESPNLPVRPALDLGGLRAGLLDATDPEQTVPRRVRQRLTLPGGWQPRDPLSPVWAAPRFDTPVYRDLVALSHEYLIPGAADVPPNSVTALATNPRFVEALLVGANHEMARELLWRGFPTDQRGTCFRRFWDRAGSVGGPADDIGPIHDWSGDLGSHLSGGEQVVLIVRGEVLHRYPRTVVYAAAARWDNGHRVPVVPGAGADPTAAGYPEVYPVFSGTIPPDITFLGFDLDPDVAHGDPVPAADDPGWFFMFQQPPGEPRLGLDAPSPGAETKLSWATVARSGSGHINLGGGVANVTVAGWGITSTSAAIAALTEQLPFRIAIHASDLLPEATP